MRRPGILRRTREATTILSFAGGVPGWLIATFVVLLGLAFGSFLNVCISRLPRHESIVHPGSRCPRCHAAIRPLDNIPLLSWLTLRGRCRACRCPIPWRYPAVETANACLFLLCFLLFGISSAGIGLAILCFLLLGLAVMDAETMRLPDAFTLPGIAMGILWAGVSLGTIAGRQGGDYLPFGAAGTQSETWIPLPAGLAAAVTPMLLSAISATLAALLILAIRWLYFLARRQEGMGLGDAKLLAMIAAWLGLAMTVLTLLLAVVSASVVGLLWISLRRRRNSLTARLPFGSFLCAAALYSIFLGQPLIKWYLSFFR